MPYQQDPFIEREREKYGAPVPSREFLLDYFVQQKVPLSLQDLIQGLGIESDELQEGLHRRLRAMERDGQLVFTRKQRYVVADKLDFIKGKVIGHREGYGFLQVEGQAKDFYLSPFEMQKVVNGDVILAQPMTYQAKGRLEARVVRVLEPNQSAIVGRYFTEAGIGYVVPDDSRYHFDILVTDENSLNAKMGSVVVVTLIQRPSKRIKALGRITEILGGQMGPNIAVDIALRSHDIPYQWPVEVEKALSSFGDEVPEKAKKGRVDLRKLPLITIDGEDARDFDDAVYCEKKARGGWRLWVAIADVSYYVRPQTALDKEAFQRGTSVYFPSRVIPMLPEVLSNGLCSLNPDVDRLCLVCEMSISARGNISSYQFYDAVMKSHARMTYTKVQQILDGDEELCERYKAILTPINALHELYQNLAVAREERGGISFESEEPLFIFNAQKRIERVELRERNEAHKIIEECMILANVAAAKFVLKAKQPALFRVHDKPKKENLYSVRSVLNELGLTLGGADSPEPKDYALLMKQIEDRPDKEMLQTLLLRSMKQAIYDADNRGHFGLALSAYSHFTSPIRRYPDLLLHRVIKYIINKGSETDIENTVTPTGGFAYPLNDMLFFGQHCSMTERRADEATRDVIDWLKCDFMSDHIGEVYEGVVSGVTGFGFFVRLKAFFIDGLVHVATLDNDYYRFDLDRQRLVGEASGKTFRVGDSVTVRVEAVSLEERKIDFGLVSAQMSKSRKASTKNGSKQKGERRTQDSAKRRSRSQFSPEEKASKKRSISRKSEANAAPVKKKKEHAENKKKSVAVKANKQKSS